MAVPTVANWQAQILKGVGAPTTPQNFDVLDAWAKAEGGTATNNPFNTTQPLPGATSYNSVGVRNYQTPQQGIDATIQTLKGPVGNYGPILDALRAGNDPTAVGQAIANSQWGTGPGVLKVLGASPSPSVPASVPLSGVPTSVPKTTIAPLAPTTPAPVSPLSVIQGLQSGNLLGGIISGLMSTPQAQASAPVKSGTTPNGTTVEIQGKPTAKDAAAVKLAENFIGTPYVWGGASPKSGFDCSGLLQYVWGQQGVSIPRTTYAQFQSGTPVAKNQLKPGDAVYFTGSDPKNGLPGHVGMYIGGGKFVEAPHTGADVRVSTLAGRKDYVGARSFD